jgi:hypothetical protein
MKRIAAAVTTAAAIAATVLSTAGVATANDIGWPVPPKTTTAAPTDGDIGWPVAPGTTATEGIA